ncbi:hypothetical protein AN640_03385 [Candidatus Epulonipiscium fishelsonii]|uniref:Uncharacterized protein n=1 Tax=Candidatus Epulonipiscium fishelsonii TaxID=77094 RepID=A0ACC8XJ60_9FIRM|nr:hypothetical protein AN640_03385 [Epulopiscium sp. SCG-D08WGA-EpuloA1]
MKEAVGQDGARKIYIQGAVEVSLDLTKDKFWNIFIGFIEGNNWLFDGKIREIIDGYYINEDGTKGRHAFDD